MKYCFQRFPYFLGIIANLLTVVLCCGSAYAKTSLYTVEIILFENLTRSSLQEEPQINEKTPDVQSIHGERLSIKKRSTSQGSLASHRKRLASSRHFRVLQHALWEQEIPAYPQTATIVIDDSSVLEGTLTFSRQNYVNVRADLWFKSHAMHATERVKLKKLHYFDHPAFGLLIQVNSVGSTM